MDTIVAPITPLVNSAVIVVRISGDDALKGLTLFNIDFCEPRRVYFCKYIGTELSDDVLLTFYKAPNSYTGEDILEVSFHGNPIIVSLFISDCYKLGFRYAEPGEFTKRRFLNGKIDLAQAESVLELINAKSKYSVQFSYNTLSGGLKKEIGKIIEDLIDVGSILEAFIEFPEEDLDTSALDSINSKVDAISKKVNDLLASYTRIQHYRNGFSVVIAGKPNVGKSTLLNFLLAQERSIVSEIPGTTRDYILEYANLGGIPIKLIDTAGVRKSDDKIEKLGIDRSIDLIEKADLILVLLDATSFDEEDQYILELTEGKNRLVCVNKLDLNSEIPFSYDLAFSIKFSQNTDSIVPAIVSKLSSVDAESSSVSIMINERHYTIFQRFLEHLNLFKEALVKDDYDIAAFEIKESLDLLYEITGERYTEDIINNIFDKFCIGK